MGRRLEIAAAAALTAAALWAGQARAADEASPEAASSSSGLHIELNRVTDNGGGGCRLTFVVRNATGGEVPQPRFEFVLFDSDGLVDRLTTFDFGALAPEKTSVRQFDLAGVACGKLGRILVNGPAQCGEGGAAAHCQAQLSLASRADIPLGR